MRSSGWIGICYAVDCRPVLNNKIAGRLAALLQKAVGVGDLTGVKGSELSLGVYADSTCREGGSSREVASVLKIIFASDKVCWFDWPVLLLRVRRGKSDDDVFSDRSNLCIAIGRASAKSGALGCCHRAAAVRQVEASDVENVESEHAAFAISAHNIFESALSTQLAGEDRLKKRW